MVISGTAMLIMALIGLASAGASAGAAVYSAKKNYDAQMQTNEQNIQMQNATNAQNQYNIEHAHQIEMEDLKAAGLNPVLTATGGSGAPIQALNSPKAVAPQMDLSGIGSAMSGLSHMATSMLMMNMMQENAQARNATLSSIAASKNAQSAANAALRAQTLEKIHVNKYGASQNLNMGYNSANSAKFMEKAAKSFGMSPEEFQKMIHSKWVRR